MLRARQRGFIGRPAEVLLMGVMAERLAGGGLWVD
jgi:hypothetical protein